jgi:DNA (cytosine-5)-methyltransferase 1
MRYGSVCSGIEAATSAWHALGWTPQWFSEIEPFPSAVLAHHYPNVPNFGDMTKFKEWKLDDSTDIDVLVGGTPCQSFSVAGLRKGLDDPLTAAYGTKWNGNASADNGSLFVQHPVAYAFDSLSSNSMKSSNPDSGVNQVDVSKTLDTSRGLDPSCNQGGIGVVQSVSACDVADTLTVGANQTTGFIGDVVAIPISTQNALGRVNGRDDWPLGIFNDGDPAPTLSKSHGHAVATNVGVVHGTQDPCVSDIAFTQGRNNGGENVLFSPMAVRRLTPIECERLQGFPDNYTNIPWRKKPESPDGPRYKALGNSMAVPCMVWLGKRIQMVEDL